MKPRGVSAYFFDRERVFGHVLAAWPSIRDELLVVNAGWKGARWICQAEGFSEVAVMEGFFPSFAGAFADAVIMRQTVR